jgi:hypothetical protein
MASTVTVTLPDHAHLDADLISAILTLVETGLRAPDGADLYLGFSGGEISAKRLTFRGNGRERLIGGSTLPREF